VRVGQVICRPQSGVKGDGTDASPNREAVIAITIEKAKRVIDEQGDRIFRDA